MSIPEIILYDIPTNAANSPSTWSPNTQKIKFALNYKHLPFTTSWIEFLDIEPTFKQLGIHPHGKDIFAPAAYTVPTIVTDAHATPKQILMESSVIAAYLDETYPTRALYRGSAESQQAQKKFIQLVDYQCIVPIQPLIMPTLLQNLSPASAAYFRRTREAMYGATVEELIAGPKLEGQWAKAEEGLNVLVAFVDEAEKDGKQVLVVADEEGKTEPTYAAFVLASAFAWMVRVGPAGGWERFKALNDGRWGKLWDLGEPYL